MTGGSAAVVKLDEEQRKKYAETSDQYTVPGLQPEPCRTSSILRKQGKNNYLRKNVSWLDHNGLHCLVEVREIPSNNMGKKCNKSNEDIYVEIQQECQSGEEAVETADVNIPSADKQDDKDESIKERSPVILADEQDKKAAAISMRKLFDYAIPEEQVILEKVTVVVSEKPYRTSEPSEQQQLEKSIPSITASAESAVDSLDDDGPGAVEVAGDVGEPQPVHPLDDDPLGPGAGEEKIMEFFVSRKCAGFVTG